MFCLNFTFRHRRDVASTTPTIQNAHHGPVRMLQKILHNSSHYYSRIWSPVNSFTCLNGWPTYNWGRFGASMIQHQPQVPNQTFPQKNRCQGPLFYQPSPTYHEFPKRQVHRVGRSTATGIQRWYHAPLRRAGGSLNAGPGTHLACHQRLFRWVSWMVWICMDGMKGCQVPHVCFFWEWWTWSCCEFWWNFWIDGNWLGMFSRS